MSVQKQETQSYMQYAHFLSITPAMQLLST